MHALMLHYIDVLIGSVLTLIFVYSHQKFIVDYLLRVLVGSDASVYEFDYFSYVFAFEDIRHDFRH